MARPPKSTDKTDPSDKTTVLQGEQQTLERELLKAKEQEACLIIIRGTPQGHRFFLTAAEMTIGRDPTVEISVADQSISRKHALISKKEGKVFITDMGSSNGTFINDKKMSNGEVLALAKEDMIKLGNSIFKFLPAGQLEILFYGNLGSAAHTDPLTKIYNKGYLQEALEAEYKRAKALHTDFSILFLDIDFFKKINDTFGHDCGDYVLKEISRIIKNSFVRPKDIFARYGGEEFVLLMGNTDLKCAQSIAEKTRQAISTYALIYEGKKLSVTISIGVACLSSAMDSASELLKAADKALYAAKKAGRNQVALG